MGSPDMWFKIFLEYFAKALSDKKDCEQIKQMSLMELEMYIGSKQIAVNKERFFYLAGIAAHAAISEAIECGSDAATAASGALFEYEDFIGL